MTGPTEPLGGSGVPGPEVPVFVISVAAELTGMHPQTLRTYDRLGLVTPGRTGGGGRRYSLRDIDALRVVARLTAEGLGLAGVRRVLELEREVQLLTEQIAHLEQELEAAHAALSARLGSHSNVPVRREASQVVVWRRG
ncbi:MAG: MerR family transcriptional regulator [Actinomycetota bacterium]|nr:MerR family transcriptional regulator [Actinomycetota bacterium]